jgi:hypothetical protein
MKKIILTVVLPALLVIVFMYALFSKNLYINGEIPTDNPNGNEIKEECNKN